MKANALICHGIKKLTWEKVDLPEKPDPHEVLVKTAFSQISVGTELAVYSGSHIGYRIPNSKFPRFPWPVGYASAGTVLAVGEEVKDIKKGDKIATSAAHADYSLSDVRKTIVRPLPKNVTLEQGAMSRMAGISLTGIRRSKIAIGESALVFGMGLIGNYAAQLCFLSGCRPVIGVDLITSRLQIAEKMGIKTIQADKEDVLKRAMEILGGKKPELVIEAIGNNKVIEQAVGLAAEGGRVILLGSPREKVNLDVYTTVHRLGIDIIGAHDRFAASAPTFFDKFTKTYNTDTILSLYNDNTLKIDGLINHIIKPEEIEDYYKKVMDKPEDYMGIMVDWEKK